MPVSQKPRIRYRDRNMEGRGPNIFSAAGKLLYGFYDAAAAARRAYAQATVARMLREDQRRSRRRSGNSAWIPANADSREAQRRRRQGVYHTQHPSVIARFANHPTQAHIEAVAQEVEKKTGLVAGAKRALSRLKPKPAVA